MVTDPTCFNRRKRLPKHRKRRLKRQGNL
jgi:hypothetical protein